MYTTASCKATPLISEVQSKISKCENLFVGLEHLTVIELVYTPTTS